MCLFYKDRNDACNIELFNCSKGLLYVQTIKSLPFSAFDISPQKYWSGRSCIMNDRVTYFPFPWSSDCAKWPMMVLRRTRHASGATLSPCPRSRCPSTRVRRPSGARLPAGTPRRPPPSRNTPVVSRPGARPTRRSRDLIAGHVTGQLVVSAQRGPAGRRQCAVSEWPIGGRSRSGDGYRR